MGTGRLLTLTGIFGVLIPIVTQALWDQSAGQVITDWSSTRAVFMVQYCVRSDHEPSLSVGTDPYAVRHCAGRLGLVATERANQHRREPLRQMDLVPTLRTSRTNVADHRSSWPRRTHLAGQDFTTCQSRQSRDLRLHSGFHGLGRR